MAELDLSEAAQAGAVALHIERAHDGHAEWCGAGPSASHVADALLTITAAAPIIERQVREMVAAEREQIDRFPAQVESFGAELAALPDPDVARIGRALIGASRLIQGGNS